MTPEDAERPLVSVIMPAFNVERYVVEAIESVLAQRFEAFELLVADDASTDRTGQVVQRYAGHPRVRLFRHERRIGAAAARNRLIREARGHYVCPCDADDLLLPGALRRLSEFLETHPDAGVVYADILVLDTGVNDELVGSPELCGADCGRTWDLIENVVNHGGSLSRRDVLLRAGGYDETLHSVDDWGLWLKVAELTRIRYLAGEVYYVWRRHPRSMTRLESHYDRDVARIRREAAERRGFY